MLRKGLKRASGSFVLLIGILGEEAELTRFEKARILGARSLQIAQGAQAQIKTREEDPIDIAREENDAGATPMTVVRKIGITKKTKNPEEAD